MPHSRKKSYSDKGYQCLVDSVSNAYLTGRLKAFRAINYQLIMTNWEIGRKIVEFEQGGKKKAERGKDLLAVLSKDLGHIHGTAVNMSMSNLSRIRQFYQVYSIPAELPQELTWSHIVELLKINDPLERSFYQNQAIAENWSTAELITQMESSLFSRLRVRTNHRAGSAAGIG